MKTFAIVPCLIFALAQTASAQDLTIDAQIVRDCFAAAEVGALYPSCLGQASSQCQLGDAGSSTLGTVECIQAEAAEWDKILNEEYKATQAVNAKADDAGYSLLMDRTDALRDAQRAWITFRDADCTARYAMWQDGTIRSIVGANCHLTKTASRALALRDMRGF